MHCSELLKLVIEEEGVARRIFIDLIIDTQLLREYRCERQSILCLIATLEPYIEHQTQRSHALPALLQLLFLLYFSVCPLSAELSIEQP